MHTLLYFLILWVSDILIIVSWVIKYHIIKYGLFWYENGNEGLEYKTKNVDVAIEFIDKKRKNKMTIIIKNEEIDAQIFD